MPCRKLAYYIPYRADKLVREDTCFRREILKLIKASSSGSTIHIEAGTGINLSGTGTQADPYIISAVGGGSTQESYYMDFVSDGDPAPVFTELIDATLIWFSVEDTPYGIPSEVDLDTNTGTLDIIGGIGAGQRVKLQYKKIP